MLDVTSSLAHPNVLTLTVVSASLRTPNWLQYEIISYAEYAGVQSSLQIKFSWNANVACNLVWYILQSRVTPSGLFKWKTSVYVDNLCVLHSNSEFDS